MLCFTVALWTSIALNNVIRMAGKDRPQVIGSSRPITAVLGDDCVLPCRVEPRLNAEELEVFWWRPDVQPDPTDPLSAYRYVHCYRQSHDVEDRKMPAYVGRTALFTDDLKHGNISLKIRSVTLSDQGRYRCQVPELGSASVIRLFVEPKSVQTTETLLQHTSPRTPTEEESSAGGRLRLAALIPFLFLVLILVAGAARYYFINKVM